MAVPDTDEEAARLAKHCGCDVIIIDANDIAATVLGKSRKDMPTAFGEQVFRDNPHDQCSQQTPISIVRKVAK